MPDPTGDAKRSTYSREDASTKRLWRTQIGKANPWEHRTRPDGEDDAGQDADDEPRRKRRTPPPPATMIDQDDALLLDIHDADRIANPFASLLAHNKMFVDGDDTDDRSRT